MKTKTILRKAAMQGDLAAMSAYADYLEEIEKEKELAAGLRFCVKYRKFPKVHHNRSLYWWNCSKLNKITRSHSTLPLFLEHLTFTDFCSAMSAITALGRNVLQINLMFKDIV